MPIYEYRCAYCRHKWEVLVMSKRDQPEKCPECGSDKIKKVPSAHIPIVR